MSRGPVVTWEQATRARFNNAGTQVGEGRESIICVHLSPPLSNFRPPQTNAHIQVSAVSCSSSVPRQAFIFDVTTHARLMALQEAPGMYGNAGLASPSRAERAGRSALSAAWSPSDDLIMWGSTLWDLRVPKVGGFASKTHPDSWLTVPPALSEMMLISRARMLC